MRRARSNHLQGHVAASLMSSCETTNLPVLVRNAGASRSGCFGVSQASAQELLEQPAVSLQEVEQHQVREVLRCESLNNTVEAPVARLHGSALASCSQQLFLTCTGLLHTIIFNRALGRVQPKEIESELIDITYVRFSHVSPRVLTRLRKDVRCLTRTRVSGVLWRSCCGAEGRG